MDDPLKHGIMTAHRKRLHAPFRDPKRLDPSTPWKRIRPKARTFPTHSQPECPRASSHGIPMS